MWNCRFTKICTYFAQQIQQPIPKLTNPEISIVFNNQNFLWQKKMKNEKPRLVKLVPIVPNNSWKFEFVGLELVVESGEFIKHFISLYPLQSSPLAYNCKWNTFLFIWIPTVSSCSQLFFSFGRPGHIFFAQSHYFLWAWVGMWSSLTLTQFSCESSK